MSRSLHIDSDYNLARTRDPRGPFPVPERHTGGIWIKTEATLDNSSLTTSAPAQDPAAGLPAALKATHHQTAPSKQPSARLLSTQPSPFKATTPGVPLSKRPLPKASPNTILATTRRRTKPTRRPQAAARSKLSISQLPPSSSSIAKAASTMTKTPSKKTPAKRSQANTPQTKMAAPTKMAVDKSFAARPSEANNTHLKSAGPQSNESNLASQTASTIPFESSGSRSFPIDVTNTDNSQASDTFYTTGAQAFSTSGSLALQRGAPPQPENMFLPHFSPLSPKSYSRIYHDASKIFGGNIKDIVTMPLSEFTKNKGNSVSSHQQHLHSATNTKTVPSSMRGDDRAHVDHDSSSSDDMPLSRNEQQEVQTRQLQSQSTHKSVAFGLAPEGSGEPPSSIPKPVPVSNQGEASKPAVSATSDTTADFEYVKKLLEVRGDSVLLLGTYKDAMKFQETYFEMINKASGDEDDFTPTTDKDRHYLVSAIARAMMDIESVRKRKPDPDADLSAPERAKKRRISRDISPHASEQQQTAGGKADEGWHDSGRDVARIKQTPTVLFQGKAWEILYDIEVAQQVRASVPDGEIGVPESQPFGSFLERFSAVVATLRFRKDLVVKLFDAPFSKTLAGNPSQ